VVPELVAGCTPRSRAGRRPIVHIGDIAIALIALGVWLFGLIDVVTTPTSSIRHLHRGWWLTIVVLLGPIGAALWLLGGRRRTKGARGAARRVPPRQRVVGPDDDPEFLARIHIPTFQEKELLSWWEADLQRRGDDRSSGESSSGLH
jgi:hypothetical protein